MEEKGSDLTVRKQYPKMLYGLTINRLVILIVFFAIGAGLLFWGGSKMKREIPFQEIIPFRGGVCVVTAGNWYLDKLELSLYSENRVVERKSFNKEGLCLFNGLPEGKTYTLEIKRIDLKGRILYRPLRAVIDFGAISAKYFVLVGASVGRAWEFPKIPSRLGLGNQLIFGNRTKYEFDKTSEIVLLTKMPIKPFGVIIKECAAYFPRDLEGSQELIKKWVGMLRSHDIKPILATVVPVTKEHDSKNPGRFQEILVFNDFIRAYAVREGLLVLDLEKALRLDDTDRHLKSEFAAPDGLHLIERAYREVLDKMASRVVTQSILNQIS